MTTTTKTTLTSTTPATQTKKDEFDPKVAAAYVSQFGSISGAIRGLTAMGKTRGEVAKILGKRYQHVRNVLITPVKSPKAVAAK
jgi:hypothetical protein